MTVFLCYNGKSKFSHVKCGGEDNKKYLVR